MSSFLKQASFLCDKQWLFLLYNPHSEPQPIIYDCHSVDRKCWSVYCVRSLLAQPPHCLCLRLFFSDANLCRFLLSTKDLKPFHSTADTRANTAAQCCCRKCFHRATMLCQCRFLFLNNINIYIFFSSVPLETFIPVQTNTTLRVWARFHSILWFNAFQPEPLKVIFCLLNEAKYLPKTTCELNCQTQINVAINAVLWDLQGGPTVRTHVVYPII